MKWTDWKVCRTNSFRKLAQTTPNAMYNLQVIKRWTLPRRSLELLQQQLSSDTNLILSYHDARTDRKTMLPQRSSEAQAQGHETEWRKGRSRLRRETYRRFGGRIAAGRESTSWNGRFQMCRSLQMTRTPEPLQWTCLLLSLYLTCAGDFILLFYTIEVGGSNCPITEEKVIKRAKIKIHSEAKCSSETDDKLCLYSFHCTVFRYK